MDKVKTGGYVSEIRFNNGETVDIKPNDIILFVGPNNTGKSQALKDIYALSKEKVPTTVVNDVKITKYEGKISSLLDFISVGINHGSYTSYQVLGGVVTVHSFTDQEFLSSPYYDNCREVFVANLDTSARLSICQPAGSIPRNAPKQHPIHYAAFTSSYRKWLSESFKKAFGIEMIPNTQFGGVIPLCLGEAVKFYEEFEDEQSRQEAYATVLESYKQVQEQGDGIKSFTGILLYLMLNYYCTYLIDEPESFLHPPQAKIMGQIIGETLSGDQQAFISTHSEELVKGLLDVCPERLKIIRITRIEDINEFSVLDNNELTKVWKDPLLRYSNIMSGLFHKTVVLCESDADCQMYSIIENYIKQKNGKYSETLFIHCGGKQRMAKVITALHALNVDVHLVADLDVLNSESIIKEIANAYDIQWTTIRNDYNILASNLHSNRERVNRKEAKSSISQILCEKADDSLSQDEIRKIREAVKTTSKWDDFKKMGVAAIPSGDASVAFGRINAKFKSVGIHLVPVGELECFIKEVGGHGPMWVNNVLENYPDLDNNAYSKIKEFITELGL